MCVRAKTLRFFATIFEGISEGRVLGGMCQSQYPCGFQPLIPIPPSPPEIKAKATFGWLLLLLRQRRRVGHLHGPRVRFEGLGVLAEHSPNRPSAGRRRWPAPRAAGARSYIPLLQ